MARPRKQDEPLPTIWHAPEGLWREVRAVLAELDPPARTGAPRIDPRGAFDAMIFRLRSGCQWNRLPEAYPDDASVHRTMQRWQRLGVFERLWAVLVEHCQELGGVDRLWQSADCSMGKARMGATRWAPTPPTAARTASNAA